MKKALLILCLSTTSWAQTLPTPLTLGDVLSWSSPGFKQAQQHLSIDGQALDLEAIEDAYNLQSSLDLALARREEYTQGENNSHGFIHLKKTLFDQSVEVNKDAQQAQLQISKAKLKQLQHDREVSLMRGFFDIVLADMSYETELQRLANAAVKQNRVQEDYDFQAASEVELLERQSQTQRANIGRIQAEAKQISTRAKLAQLLNLDYEQRPDDVVRPNFQHLFERKLPEFEHYQQQLFNNNPTLKQLQDSLSATQTQIQQEHNNLGLTLNSSARLGEQAYQRDKNGQWRVGLNLSMPLGRDDKKQQRIARLELKAKQTQLELEQYQHSLLAQALDYHLKLKTLRQTHRALIIELDYRDLFLERARANYEMGLKSGIGNAMTDFTDTERKLSQNEFDYLITLKQLYFLVGETYEI